MADDKVERFSRALEPELITDGTEKGILEVKNALRQFDLAMKMLQDAVGSGKFELRPSAVLKLNRAALQGLSAYAGVYRPADIEIVGSKHQPIAAELVTPELEQMCDYINHNWKSQSALHLAAYALWRLNWIHPFVDGNGRTARIVSYLILCAKLGYRVPGSLTIPEQIAEDKQPYYAALEAADVGYENGKIDVSDMEEIISGYLAKQLVTVHDQAAVNGVTNPKPHRTQRDAQRVAPTWSLRMVIQLIERHPVLASGIFVLLAAAVTVIFQAT